MIEGTLGHLIRDVGTILNDFTVSASADGKLTTERVTRIINLVHKRIMRKCLDWHVRPSIFARKATLTVNAVDEYAYDLPPRTLGVFAVEDSNEIQYTPVHSRKREGEIGYRLEQGQKTTGGIQVPVVRFHNIDVGSATVYAWVIEEPATLSQGDADYGAATVTFDSTPSSAGILVDQDDYYNGCEVAIVASSTATIIGQIRQISAYVAATRVATVEAWTEEPTDDDDYAIVSGLPRILWGPLAYDVACEITRLDERWDVEDRQMIRAERDRSFKEAVHVMRGMSIGPLAESFQQIVWLH